MKLFNWKLGRQEGGYKVLTLLNSKRLKLDCHIIKYGKGCFISPHRDPAREGYKHYRLNLIIKPCKKGGVFLCEYRPFRIGPLIVFRPDISEHSVTTVTEGSRWVLSIGWLKKST